MRGRVNAIRTFKGLVADLRDIRFQAFNRYINRESHSFGQNIYDFKEFNYDNFLEAFRLLFEIEGYETHYKKMMK